MLLVLWGGGVGKKANKLRVCGVRWGEDIFGGKLLEGLGPRNPGKYLVFSLEGNTTNLFFFFLLLLDSLFDA